MTLWITTTTVCVYITLYFLCASFPFISTIAVTHSLFKANHKTNLRPLMTPKFFKWSIAPPPHPSKFHPLSIIHITSFSSLPLFFYPIIKFWLDQKSLSPPKKIILSSLLYNSPPPPTCQIPPLKMFITVNLLNSPPPPPPPTLNCPTLYFSLTTLLGIFV